MIEPVLTLDQGSKKSNNWVKEHTLNHQFFHENCHPLKFLKNPDPEVLLKILKEPELEVLRF
jgi:hypothetical protein